MAGVKIVPELRALHRQLDKHPFLECRDYNKLYCTMCEDFVKGTHKHISTRVCNHLKTVAHRNASEALSRRDQRPKPVPLQTTRASNQHKRVASPEPIQVPTNVFSDLNFGPSTSPLIDLLLERLKSTLGVQDMPESLSFEEMRSSFNDLLDILRPRIGDQSVVVMLWHLISRLTAVRTEDGIYHVMMKV